ncbi:MAG: sensor histidine kinase [Actinomycetia bacterium]|nr:sensor histidine kinase [Actinomycetes bacterium]MCP4958006.1 sensor histidine kinase [Actinomycetes bacterium]
MTADRARATFEAVEVTKLETEPALGHRLVPRWVSSVPQVVQDTALTAVLAGTLMKDLANQDLPPGGSIRAADPLGYVLVILLVLPLALRRVFPRAVFATILADAVLVTLLFYKPTSFGFGLIIATYTVARYCGPRASLLAFVLAQAFAVFIKFRVQAAGINVGWFNWPLDACYMGAAWFLGRSLRSRHQYALALEQGREVLAERAVQAERTRIARELHDAVGHSISVMTLHVGAAEELIEKRPAMARDALASAGDVGRSAMAEMDQLLGLLRSDEAEPPDLLQPSLANLSTLVEEFRGLGLRVETSIDGDPVGLPTAIDQSAFRIIQEALTNTLKHAGPTHAEVNLVISKTELSVEVRDHGRPVGPRHWAPAGRRSQGIIGMRERATMLRGELEVGRCENEQGFRVSARLPIGTVGRQ